MKNIHEIEVTAINPSGDAVTIIDQTLLPGRVETKDVRTEDEMYDAIKTLAVRGAPAIGVFAAMGMYVLSRKMPDSSYEAFAEEFNRASDHINSSRPTAVNLSWALKRMQKVVSKMQGEPKEKIVPALKAEALAIRDEEVALEERIGEFGNSLIKDGDGILTHCNAGRLATLSIGTATAPMYKANKDGKKIKVYCDETRPLLQGARLTALELYQAGIDTTLLCDNMSAALMKNGKIQIIFTGCDRVAANGDTANKTGTSLVAACAHLYNIPMYICAPTSTLDLETATGADIPIEMRDPSEVTSKWYKEPMAPDGINVFNPSFDVTDHELITGIITENGIAYPPYTESLVKMKKETEKE